jgi:hypothetical protein
MDFHACQGRTASQCCQRPGSSGAGQVSWGGNLGVASVLVASKNDGNQGRQPRSYWWVALRNGPIGFFRIASTAELR